MFHHLVPCFECTTQRSTEDPKKSLKKRFNYIYADVSGAYPIVVRLSALLLRSAEKKNGIIDDENENETEKNALT